MKQASVWTKNVVLEREARELRDWQAWARLKFDELEYECAAKEREIQRLLNIVCDSPACTATVIRRDDGSRVCSAGHAARWVNVDLLYKAEAKNTSLREALRQVLEYSDCRSREALRVARAELEE